MTDAQIVSRLRYLATDAALSGDDHNARFYSEAAARILSLTEQFNFSTHPSLAKGTTNGL
jgi:hypothetical protein